MSKLFFNDKEKPNNENHYEAGAFNRMKTSNFINTEFQSKNIPKKSQTLNKLDFLDKAVIYN